MTALPGTITEKHHEDQSGTTSLAVFSADRRYRYQLSRTWDARKGSVLFLMLNPSTADAFANDPTVERCQRRAVEMGHGTLRIANIFALRSTNPKALYTAQDPVGPLNDQFIQTAAAMATLIVCGWGGHGRYRDRGDYVRRLLRALGHEVTALQINADGSPKHPLYVPYERKPQLWRGEGDVDGV